jgi:hypothetical protein
MSFGAPPNRESNPIHTTGLPVADCIKLHQDDPYTYPANDSGFKGSSSETPFPSNNPNSLFGRLSNSKTQSLTPKILIDDEDELRSQKNDHYEVPTFTANGLDSFENPGAIDFPMSSSKNIDATTELINHQILHNLQKCIHSLKMV